MQLSKEDNYGIVVTIAVHALVLLALIFAVIRVTPPDPPLPEGMEIDFGMSVDGSGTDNMAIPTGPVVSPNPTVEATPVKPVQTAPNEMATSEVGEEISRPKPQNKPVQETTKPVEVPKKPVINQGALMPGRTSTGGQGSGTMPGNQGRLDGVDGGGGQGGRGNNPNGIGDGTGTGIKISLAGRSAQSLPKPRYDEQEDGTVVVKITVDRSGNVINATTDGVRGSTTTNKTLHSEAISAARRAKFNLKADAPPEQIGYITYTFLRN